MKHSINRKSNRNRNTNLECGSKCLTIPPPTPTLTNRSVTGARSAAEGSNKFSSLHKKQITSTIQTFPTHRHSPPLPPPAAGKSGWCLSSQAHTLMQLSPTDLLSADKASATVAETGRALSAGFPRHRSDTSRARNLTAIQLLDLQGDKREREFVAEAEISRERERWGGKEVEGIQEEERYLQAANTAFIRCIFGTVKTLKITCTGFLLYSSDFQIA